MAAKTVSQSTLVIDIAPGCVKGAFVGYPTGKTPLILFERSRTFVHRERMPAAFVELLHDVLKAVSTMPQDFSREADHVLISISKPWSKTDKKIVSRLQEELVKVLGFKRGVAVENSTDAYLRGASGLYDIKHILLARPLSDSMELRLVKKGLQDEYVRIPFGSDDIEESLRRELQIPLELAPSYISLATKGLLAAEYRMKVEKALEESERTWYKLVKDIKNLPEHVLLIAEEPYAGLFATYFKDLRRGMHVTMQDGMTLLAMYSKSLL